MSHPTGDCGRSEPTENMSLRPPQRWNDELAFDSWIHGQIPMVKSIARQLKLRLPNSIEEGDLVQSGLLGLVQARERFQGQKALFGIFARRRIRGAMLDSLRQCDPAPREVRRRINRMWRIAGQLEQKLGRRPTGTEIATQSGIDLGEYYQLLSQSSVYQTLDLPYDDERLAFANPLSTSDPLQLLIDQCARERLQRAIARLPTRQRTVLHWRLGRHLKLGRIAAKLGVTESRVSQLLGTASEILRLKLARDEAGRHA